MFISIIKEVRVPIDIIVAAKIVPGPSVGSPFWPSAFICNKTGAAALTQQIIIFYSFFILLQR